MASTNTVTRVRKQVEQYVDYFMCSACDTEFVYAVGFPDYCPECGEMFDFTKDATSKETKKRDA
jgi:predicted RNA-binding Zn-ribbon protein involved in translation (DUF1610 family)